MRITVSRLRRVIVLAACLLLAVLAGFFLYARYRFRRFEKDLPSRLGINIERTANGFTYSQSNGPHTLFTIHASKLEQYKKNGHAMLHDVAITLYGPPGSNRTDKIYGSDFDYDKTSGIATAQGEVQIDLAGLGSDDSSKPKSGQPSAEDAQAGSNTIHIKTVGLSFNQKTGEAVTNGHMEFQLPKAAGSSTGANYNSKTGVLVLDSQVEITTSSNGNLAVVHAAHAQILRDSKQAFLISPSSEFQSEKNSSDQAIIYFRKDGSVERVEAQGHVLVTTDNGAVITAGNSQTQLDPQSQPLQVDLGGGVNFVSNDENRSMHGNAVEGTLTFAPGSMLKHAQFRNAVSFVDQVMKLANDPRGTASRQMQATKLDVDFVPGPDAKRSVPQKALATGNAAVNLHTIPSTGAQQLTNVSGDQLLATLDSSGTTIQQLDGTGHTKIVDLAQDGSTNTSEGDRLHMTFTPESHAAKSTAKPTGKNMVAKLGAPSPQMAKRSNANDPQTSQVDTAIQDGNVIMTQSPGKKSGAPTAPATLTAWARHAEYHDSDHQLHLSGDPRLNDGQSLQLTGDQIDYDRKSGDATAQGSVKATYTQQKAQDGATPTVPAPTLGGQGPVHITADRAQLHHASNLSVFTGSSQTPARIWQGENSILAPILELTRTPQTLKAYGAEGSTAASVSANLTSALGSRHQASVVRIHSQTLLYSDADRRGDFHGSVTAEDPNGVIHADQAQVFLAPAQKSPASQSSAASAQQLPGNPTPGQQTQIDHIVASGRVLITQPGRKGSGEKLVYTTEDGKYILTGTPGNPPHVYDQAKGTTTGATLIFNSQDDSVVVSGGQSGAVTETRTPK